MANIQTTSLLEVIGREGTPRTVEVVNKRSFVTNVVFNLGGELLVVCLGAVCIPVVVRRLGTDAFGVLSLAWVVLVYMNLFDLGLSRATTKFAAEASGRGDKHELPGLLGSSVALQFFLGLVGGSLIFVLSPWVVERLLKIPGPLVSDAVRSFRVLALAVPVILITNCARGMLEALQRFDLISYVKVPANSSIFISPLVLLPFRGTLSSIVVLMVVFRCAAMFAYLGLCLWLLPRPGLRISMDKKLLTRLLGYGGWVTVSNIVGPILMYADRFIIGMSVSVGAVAYYTAPADMVGRALIVPASLCAILFPAFSSLGAVGERSRLDGLYGRSLKYLVAGLGPVLLVISAFSRDILTFWLGAEFAHKSSLCLQILALGVFVNSLGYFPFSLLQGLGKPKLTAMIHLVEVPLHLLLIWILVTRMGIVGAAIASTSRVLVDAILLFWACSWFKLTSSRALLGQGIIQSFATLALFGVAAYLSAATVGSLLLRIAITTVLLVLYVFAQWRWSSDSRDREFLKTLGWGSGRPVTANRDDQLLPRETP